MTAEYAVNSTRREDYPSPATPNLGRMALVKGTLDEAAPTATLVLRPTTVDPGEGSQAIERGRLATYMKERFQRLGPISAQEREYAREEARRDSIRVLFKTFGMLDNDETATTRFNEAYERTFDEAYDSVADAIPDRGEPNYMEYTSFVGDLSEKYKDHPFSRVLDSFANTAGLHDDMVSMRKIGLVMIETYTVVPE